MYDKKMEKLHKNEDGKAATSELIRHFTDYVSTAYKNGSKIIRQNKLWDVIKVSRPGRKLAPVK